MPSPPYRCSVVTVTDGPRLQAHAAFINTRCRSKTEVPREAEMTKIATHRIRQMIETAFWGRPGSDRLSDRRITTYREVSRELSLVAHLGGGAVVARQAFACQWRW